MAWSDYWRALGAQQRTGLAVGAALIVVAAIAATVWLLRDPYVPLAAGLSTERLNDLAQELERIKLNYRISDAGDGIAVPKSQLGKARAAAASGPLDAPPSVGLELFKETDFSSTDFAQRVNYQRALQGELTRTIQTIAGVRSARVHVILPDNGLFKRNAAKATAAVSIALQPGKSLTRSQVLGIQRLVAASVPDITAGDVVVLDETGASLARATSEAEGDLSSAQLDLKRQADQYFESKLQRLLRELVPQGVASVSVDTTLDEKQARITTEEPIAARASKEINRATGVLVRERQSQRGRPAGLVTTDGYAPESDSTDWEYEYKVGNRVEQTLSAPGSIKRVSVAVALQGAPAELSRVAVEDLVAHAVGIDPVRGDSVSVMLLADPHASAPTEGAAVPPSTSLPAASNSGSTPLRSVDTSESSVPRLKIVLALLLAASIAAALWWWLARSLRAGAADDADADAAIARVREWLNEGVSNGRR